MYKGDHKEAEAGPGSPRCICSFNNPPSSLDRVPVVMSRAKGPPLSSQRQGAMTNLPGPQFQIPQEEKLSVKVRVRALVRAEQERDCLLSVVGHNHTEDSVLPRRP